jgi:hypothetical protein
MRRLTTLEHLNAYFDQPRSIAKLSLTGAEADYA